MQAVHFILIKIRYCNILSFNLNIVQIKLQACILGKILGNLIRDAKRFDDIDIIVPLPLNEKKLFTRGYNQALLLAKGMAEVLQKPVVENAVERIQFTETQTHKNRITRWQTMEGVFKVVNESAIKK